MKRSKHGEAEAVGEAARAVFHKLGSTLSGKGGHMVEERAKEAFTVFYGKPSDQF